ncbi:hypothetical protein IJH23_03160 [Candidatus Saccharibacteria bacterium]|nr:hypothetical protein [Candidatus Saccharibacteria bacterium]
MESQEYLNQISAKVRPEKVSKGGLNFLNSIYVKIILGAVAALVLLALLGSLISGTRVDESTKVLSLNARIANTESVIKTYQTNVKSSDLRSNAASLASVLANTSRELTTYVSEKYKSKSKDAQKAIETKATTDKEELETELFSAKINGILDRIFAHKMAYEISVIATREEEIINSTGKAELKEILTTSYESLANLYDKFNDFSETK